VPRAGRVTRHRHRRGGRRDRVPARLVGVRGLRVRAGLLLPHAARSRRSRTVPRSSTGGRVAARIVSAMTNWLDERELVVKQRAKLMGVRVEYDVYGADGGELGSVVQVGRDQLERTLHPKADAGQVELAEALGIDPKR